MRSIREDENSHRETMNLNYQVHNEAIYQSTTNGSINEYVVPYEEPHTTEGRTRPASVMLEQLIDRVKQPKQIINAHELQKVIISRLEEDRLAFNLLVDIKARLIEILYVIEKNIVKYDDYNRIRTPKVTKTRALKNLFCCLCTQTNT